MMSDDYAMQSVGEYVREGTLLALPLCFPDQTLPPPAGETATSAMEIDPNGTVYLGTRGTKAHLLAAMLRQDTGIVYHVGAIPDATSVDALVVHDDALFFVASGPRGTALWRTSRISGKFMVQEWEIVRPALKRIGSLPLTACVGAVASADGSRLFLVDAPSGEIVQIETRSGRVMAHHDTGGGGRNGTALCRDAEGRIWGSSGKASLWVLSPQTATLEKTDLTIPCSAGREQHTQVSAWAADPVTGMLYGGSAPDGFLFALDPHARRITSLGKPTRQEPITCLTVGNDGALIGMAGGDDDIGHMFRYEPDTRSLVDLGIPISTLSTRQYGYVFSGARTGRDGEMYFGQSERVNHLWVYFPPVPRRPAMK
jgi:hypothetical protein